FMPNGDELIFWAWKGDYINLGAGAEFGLYRRLVVNGYETEHWLVDKNLALPMTLTLKDNKGNTIFSYAPSANQWWITGFNPEFKDVKAGNLTAIYNINFSGNIDMFNAFYNTWNGKDIRWVFDTTNYTATFTF
ncbi:MAG: DUF4474 domain-containing protein, partial [Firmicutes bacterium]|nr:DUF4474 domain-containing protein [Bacillota bacterium]